jgi:hypothetical protein
VAVGVLPRCAHVLIVVNVNAETEDLPVDGQLSYVAVVDVTAGGVMHDLVLQLHGNSPE